MTDDVTHLRALLAEQTTRAERAEVDYRRVLSERAAANQLAGRCAQQRVAALAACAEMRAALELAAYRLEVADGAFTQHWACDFGRFAIEAAAARALLARTDLGRGMVAVPREMVERVVADLSAATPYAETDEGLARVTRDIATLAALLDGGKGRG